MPKLSEKDLAILRARGKVMNGFHTSTDFEIPSSVKPKKKKKVKKANPNANHPLIGKILHTSWGYNMTINEYCKIVEVSPTGKTVVCRMVNTKCVDPGATAYAGRVKAGENTYGVKFRLKVNSHGGFHGSFPYIVGNTKEECSFKMGYFSIDDGGYAYENHMD